MGEVPWGGGAYVQIVVRGGGDNPAPQNGTTPGVDGQTYAQDYVHIEACQGYSDWNY
jgi:hypothetical protein